MPYYETVFIARQDISAPQVEGLADGFAAIVKDNGGEVTKKEFWGLKNLAYRIAKNRKGHYVLFNIEAPFAAVREMERQMSIDENVLRVLTLRVDALEEGPSAQLRRDERAERGERGAGSDRPRRPRRDDRDDYASEGIEE